MMKVRLMISYLVCLTACLALPLSYNIEERQELQNHAEQSGSIFGAMRIALVPVFRAVLSNLANSIATTFNNDSATGANGNQHDNSNANNVLDNSDYSIKNNNNANNNRSRPTFNTYMIQLPGSEAPFMIVTNQNINDLAVTDDELVKLKYVLSKMQLKVDDRQLL